MWDIQINVIQTFVRLTNKCDNYKTDVRHTYKYKTYRQMWDLQTNMRLTSKYETYKQMWDFQTNVTPTYTCEVILTNKCERYR